MPGSLRRRRRFDRFSENARRALYLANDEALRLRDNYVGVEHLFLGLLRPEESSALQVLVNLRVPLTKLQDALATSLQPSEHRIAGAQSLTQGARSAIEYAVDEARRLGCDYLGTEHLLLGVMRDEQGIPGRVLLDLGLDLARAREEVQRLTAEKRDQERR